jgi:Cu-Zn family superoxide dismutase
MRETCIEESRRPWRIRTLLRVMLGVLWLVAACGPAKVEPEKAEPESAMPPQEETAPQKETNLPGKGPIQEESLPPEGAAAPEAKTATATIGPASGSSVSGTAQFEQGDGFLKISIQLSGATRGLHAVHIHETGDCSAPDASSAGGHFNPGGNMHGSPADADHHAGDLWNMEIGDDGAGKITMINRVLTLDEGPNAIRGRAIVIHANADDYRTQPSGNSGARIGCGVIR